ncbi:MAG: hypothetical protein JNL50_10170 [Phycisphaerae bacterium]|nr:hypothetical protein [Phycisphaerae bacterium]
MVAGNSPAAALRGRRSFIAGCVVLILFSSVHTIPMFIGLFSEPTAPLEVEARRAMTAVAVDIGPIRSDWTKLNHLLSTSYSALLYFVAAVNLVALPAVIAHGRLRALAVVNMVFSAVLLGLSAVFMFPPPGVFALAAAVCFACAAAGAGASRS